MIIIEIMISPGDLEKILCRPPVLREPRARNFIFSEALYSSAISDYFKLVFGLAISLFSNGYCDCRVNY